MKSNIQINGQTSDAALGFSIINPNDWNRFYRTQYPDGNWQLWIDTAMFDAFATKVGFSYNLLRYGPNSKPYKLEIRNNVTGKTRVFEYLGLDSMYNIDHWYSAEPKTPAYGNKRIDLFIELN